MTDDELIARVLELSKKKVNNWEDLIDLAPVLARRLREANWLLDQIGDLAKVLRETVKPEEKS